jgi:hypothetical protein
MPELDIASNIIRYQVPRLVEAYIREQNLYGASSQTEPHTVRAMIHAKQ